MKKKQLVKRMAAAFLTAVMAFSTIGECDSLLAAELEIEEMESTETVEVESTEVITSENTESSEIEYDLKAADTDNTASAAKNIVVGIETTDTLDSKADVDYFKFTTDGTDSFYRFTFASIDISGTTYFEIYSDENALNKIGDEGCFAKDTVTVNLAKLERNHTYYIKVYHSEYNSGAGKYKFIVNKTVDDNKDTMAEAANVAVGTEINGRLDNLKDVDCFKFTTDGTDSFYKATFSNIDASGTVYYFMYSDENELNKIVDISCSKKGTNTVNLVKLEQNHTYYIKIVPKEYGYSDGNYRFVINKSEDDFKDTMTEAADISFGKEVSAKLENEDDEDCFKFTTDNTDSFYTFACSNVDSSEAVYYHIYSDENELQKVVDGYSNQKGTSTANLKKLEKNHTYYVRIKYGYWHSTGNYKFVVKKAKDDVKDTASSAKTISLNETKKYSLQNSEDVDCFKFKTTSYTKYQVNFANVNSENNVHIRIYSGKDCLNNQLVLDQYVSKKQSLSSYYRTLELKSDKTYYVVISGSTIGDYKLGIDAAAPESAKAKSASKKVTITWKKVAKATGYEVYRSTSRNGKYKKIATIKKNSTVKYTDSKGLKKGKTYYYKVRAYKKSGKKTYYSAYTAVKSVKVK